MTLTREIREALLAVLGPVPYLILLLPVLSLAAALHVIAFLFVASILASFFYLFLTRGLNELRTNLAKRKENIPDSEIEYEGGTRWERFWEISYEAFFGDPRDIEPIAEHTNRPLFRYAVFTFWSFVVAVFVFFSSATILAWVLTNDDLGQTVETMAIQWTQLGQVVPFTSIDLLLGFLPLLGELSFENQLFVGGVILATGFIFLTGARNLSVITDEIHRRWLRFLVQHNPISSHELLQVAIVLGVYILILWIV
jgi:hypothetical protein